MKTRLTIPLLALAFLATPLLGQTSQTFHACYVPDVGAMYLIQLPGLPSQCLSTGHQEISWTEGGESGLGDGSVTTAKIADGAVTAAKLGADVSLVGELANESVTTLKLADEAVTTGKLALGSVTTDRIATTAVGSAQLANAAVGTASLQDGSVTKNKLGPDVALPPGDCSQDQVIKWSGSAWICSEPEPKTFFMRVLKDGTVDFSNLAGVTVSNGGNGFYQVVLPIDVSGCAIVAKEERDAIGQKFYVKFERTAQGFSYNTEKETGDWQLVVNWVIHCP